MPERPETTGRNGTEEHTPESPPTETRVLPTPFYCEGCDRCLIDTGMSYSQNVSGQEWGNVYIASSHGEMEDEREDYETNDWQESHYTCRECDNDISNEQHTKIQNILELLKGHRTTLPPIPPNPGSNTISVGNHYPSIFISQPQTPGTTPTESLWKLGPEFVAFLKIKVLRGEVASFNWNRYNNDPIEPPKQEKDFEDL